MPKKKEVKIQKDGDLISRIKKNTIVNAVGSVEEINYFDRDDAVTTSIPALNIAFSGELDGGFYPGITMWAGQSKRFKTMFSLLMAKAFLEKYENGVILFYDTEYGAPNNFFDTLGINKDRVIVMPIDSIEQLESDMLIHMKSFNKEDHVMIILDSLGSLPSQKELDDALTQNHVVEMTRPKSFKGFFRTILPTLKNRKIPMVIINHTYKQMTGMYAKDVVGGGAGAYYSADSVFIVKRTPIKNKSDKVIGHYFHVHVDKSRITREGVVHNIAVEFDGPINKYSGLMEIAVESGHVKVPSAGWFQKSGEDKKYRLSATHNAKFWDTILEDESFKEYVYKTHCLNRDLIIKVDESNLETDDIDISKIIDDEED